MAIEAPYFRFATTNYDTSELALVNCHLFGGNAVDESPCQSGMESSDCLVQVNRKKIDKSRVASLNMLSGPLRVELQKVAHSTL